MWGVKKKKQICILQAGIRFLDFLDITRDLALEFWLEYQWREKYPLAFSLPGTGFESWAMGIGSALDRSKLQLSFLVSLFTLR